MSLVHTLAEETFPLDFWKGPWTAVLDPAAYLLSFQTSLGQTNQPGNQVPIFGGETAWSLT